MHGIYFFIVYGVSLILASLFVYYRDLNQIWDVVIQLGFFLSPIVYPFSVIPARYISYYILNPMTVLVETYRNFLIYGSLPGLRSVLYLILVGVILILVGTGIFHRLERRFAEMI